MQRVATGSCLISMSRGSRTPRLTTFDEVPNLVNFGRLLVDALAAAQICSFAEEINRRASRVAPRDWPRLSELAWQKSDGKALAQSRDLLSKMIAAYTALPSVEADPTGCRELLQCVANDGAGWDPLMLKVLEVACHS